MNHTELMIEARDLRRVFEKKEAVAGDQLCGAAGRDLRLSRTQRRGQNHHHSYAYRPD